MVDYARPVERWRAFGVVAAALGALVLHAPPAVACDAGARSQARHLRPAHGRPPLIIGDSTMIFAAPLLAGRGFEADAHGCRQFAAGVAMLRARRHAHTLPRVAILALGANGAIPGGGIRQALGIMGRNRVLGLVTPKNLGSSQARMRAAARRHPDRVLLIDWARFSAGHGAWFGGDGLHVNQTGALAFARLVRRAVVPLVAPPVRALRMPRTLAGRRGCGTVRRPGRTLRVFVTRGARLVTCPRARAVARRPPLVHVARWRAYDWRATGRGPWRTVWARHDRRVVIGLAPASGAG
jgi:hypothetical protein